jgi:hypothetical protein
MVQLASKLFYKIGMMDLLWKKFCTNHIKKYDSAMSFRDYYIKYELFRNSQWDLEFSLEFSESYSSKSWTRLESQNPSQNPKELQKELHIKFRDCYGSIYTQAMSSGIFRFKVKLMSDSDEWHGIGVVNEDFPFGRDCICSSPVNAWCFTSTWRSSSTNSYDLVYNGKVNRPARVEINYKEGAHFTVTLDCYGKTMTIETGIGVQNKCWGRWGPIQIEGSIFRFFVSKCNSCDVIYELE